MFPIAKRIAVLGGKPNPWLLRDDFTNALAAGAVNGTPSTPGPGTRIVVDTLSHLSLTGGAVSVDAGINAWGNPGLWLSPAVTRLPGQLLVAEHTRSSTTGHTVVGFKAAASAGVFDDYIQFGAAGPLFVSKAGGSTSVNTFAIGGYRACIALRAAGALFFLKAGVSGQWKLIYPGVSGATASLFAGMSSFSDDFTSDYLRVPSARWLPAPIASDGMSSLAATDGLGHAEGVSGGYGVGGGSVAWSDAVGTWQVSGGAANASALAGGIAIRTLQSTTADVFVECALTRSAGNLGIVLRYADATNYVYAYHDGTNVTLRKVVGGVDSQVLAPTAAAYGAGRRLVISAVGTSFRVFYNDIAIGAVQTIGDAGLQAGLGVGLFTSNTGNTFDNFAAWAIGTSDEYAYINRYNGLVSDYGLVAFGESVTVGTAASTVQNRWANLVADAKGWNLHNSGIAATVLQNSVQNKVAVIGGAVTNNGRDTYAARVNAYNPAWVIILYGLNDIRLNDAGFSAANYQNDLGEVVDGIVANGIPASQIIIGSPTYMDPTHYGDAAPWNGGTTPKHVAYVAAAAAVAAAKGTKYTDIYQAMIDGGGDALMSADGIHPNDAGHAVIANAFLAAM